MDQVNQNLEDVLFAFDRPLSPKFFRASPMPKSGCTANASHLGIWVPSNAIWLMLSSTLQEKTLWHWWQALGDGWHTLCQ